MVKQIISSAMALAVTFFLLINSAAAEKSDKWLIYWYVCGTDIESCNIAFGNGTNLMSDDPNDLKLAEPDRNPGDATRCIKEVEKAELSPNVKIFMQAGGTYVWGHPKFRDLNAKIQTDVIAYNKNEDGTFTPVQGTVLSDKKVRVSQWFLTGSGGHTVAKPVPGGNGKMGRYVYDKNHRNWHAREQLPISGQRNTSTDMGSKEGLISFLKAGQKLEQELYPEENIRRLLIFVDHGGGINGVCIDEYTENMLSLKEIQDAFAEVRDGWNNPEEKPFEVVAFDACIMSVYETALALEDSANYMVASQESTIGKIMFGYTGLLNDLSKNPSMSGKELGKVICKTTWEDSKVTDKEFGLSSNSVFTESVIDLSAAKMNALKTAYANFNAEALRVAKENPDDIVYTFTKFKNAANVSDRFSIIGGRNPDMVDLKNFADNLKATFPELKEVSNNLVKAIDNSVVYNKRGNAFQRGGGISIYYPLNLISNGGIVDYYEAAITNYNNITKELNSESAEELYHYIVEGVNENLQIANVIDPKTNKPLRAWIIPQDSVFNLSELSDIDIELDEDKKTATIEIDEEKQKGIERVRYQLWHIIPRDDDSEKMNALLLGSDSELEENRQAGTFKISFNGKKWVTLDGNPLYIQVVSDSTHKDKNGKKISGSDICLSPILLNGEPYKMFFSRSYPNQKITLIGVVKNEDGKVTLPSGDLKSFEKGDIVTPLYIYVKSEDIENFSENSKPVEEMTFDEQKNLIANFTVRGTPITIGDKPKFEMSTLYNGIFGYAFEFVNPIGGKNVIAENSVACKIKNGKIIKVSILNDLGDIGDLED